MTAPKGRARIVGRSPELGHQNSILIQKIRIEIFNLSRLRIFDNVVVTSHRDGSGAAEGSFGGAELPIHGVRAFCRLTI